MIISTRGKNALKLMLDIYCRSDNKGGGEEYESH